MICENFVTTAIAATTILVAGMALPSQADAKDWIEKVEVKQDGIDVIPIEVSADGNGYTKIRSNNHRFLLNLYARATNGERIVAMKLGAFKNVMYFEYSGDMWSQDFDGRDVGAGSKRTVSIGFDPTIPMSKIWWEGSDPKKKCENNMQSLLNKGMKKQEILSKQHSVTAYAYFELDAVAARKNKADDGWNMKNTTNQRDGYVYEVNVVCLSANKKAGN